MITLHDALAFLHEHPEVAFATSEGDLPRIRIFQIMKQEETLLYFATSREKAVYREVKKTPAWRCSLMRLGFRFAVRAM